ncbi:MAG: hypothetical protein V2J25_07635 [Desulfatiglans sp.]|jgi:hypothetical protein|nr:hypothetical protein [Thermodesulfobacteriota bacterium]MEE4352725.1 hypothetical protein [Desulfatiglans sp.]
MNSIWKGNIINWTISVGILMIAGILLFISIKDPAIMKRLFLEGSYFIILILVLLWAYAIFRHIQKEPFGLFKLLSQNIAGIAAAALLSTLLFVTVNPSCRGLRDEANPLSTSKSMLEKRVDVITSGIHSGGNYYVIGHRVPKRPLLFPFITHIVHITSGYRIENAFVVNFIVLNLLLFSIFVVLKPYLGTAWTLSGLILVASHPAFSSMVVSGSIQPLYILFVVLSFICLKLYLDNPSETRFQLLWVQLIMLSHTRPESPIFFIVIMGLLLTLKKIKLSHFKSPIVYSTTPLLVLPLLWQRSLAKGQYGPMQLSTFFEGLAANSWEAIIHLCDIHFHSPFSGIINIIGIVGLLWFAVRFVSSSNSASKASKHFVMIGLACLLVVWIIIVQYPQHESLWHPIHSPIHAFVMRHYALFCMVFSLCCLLFLFRIIGSNTYVGLATALAIFILHHPAAMQDAMTDHWKTNEYYWVKQNLETQPDNKFLLIINRPDIYTPEDYNVINFRHASSRAPSLLVDNLSYDRIYVQQHINRKSGEPSPPTRLHSAFRLQTLAESEGFREYKFRFSEVVNMRRDEN